MSEPVWKQTRTEVLDQYFDDMLESATDDMIERGIVITPKSLCTIWLDEYGLTWDAQGAKMWLESRPWWRGYKEQYYEETIP